MTSVCRMCSGTADPGIDLLDSSHSVFTSWCLNNLGLQVDKNDFTTKVCGPCVINVKEWISFKGRSSMAQKVFKEVVQGLISAQGSSSEDSVSPRPGTSVDSTECSPGVTSSTKSKTVDLLRQVRIRPALPFKEPPFQVQHSYINLDLEKENVDDPEVVLVESDEEKKSSMSLTEKYNLKELSIVLKLLSNDDIEKYSRKQQQTQKVQFVDIEEESEGEEVTIHTKNKQKKATPVIRAESTGRSSFTSLLNEETFEMNYEAQPILTVPEFVPVEIKDERESPEKIAAYIEAELEQDEEFSEKRISMQALCSALNRNLAQKVQQSKSQSNITSSRVSGLRHKKTPHESTRTVTTEPQLQHETTPLEQHETPVVELPSPTTPIPAQNLAALLKSLPKHQEYSVISGEQNGEIVFYIKLKSKELSREAENGTESPNTTSSSQTIPSPTSTRIENTTDVSPSLEPRLVEDSPKTTEKTSALVLSQSEAENEDNITVPVVETQNTEVSETSTMNSTEDSSPNDVQPISAVQEMNESPLDKSDLRELSEFMPSILPSTPVDIPVETDKSSRLSETTSEVLSVLSTIVDIPENTGKLPESTLEIPSIPQITSPVVMLKETINALDLHELPETTPEVPSVLPSTLEDIPEETDNTSDLQEHTETTPEVPSVLPSTLVDMPEETGNTSELQSTSVNMPESPETELSSNFEEELLQDSEDIAQETEAMDVDPEEYIEESPVDVLASLPQIVESGDLSALTSEAMKQLGLTLEGSIPPRGMKYIPPKPTPPTLVSKPIQNVTISSKQPVISNPIISIVSPKKSIVSNPGTLKSIASTVCSKQPVILNPGTLQSIISTKYPNLNKHENVDVSKNDTDVNIRRHNSGRLAAKKACEKLTQTIDSESEDDPDDPDVAFNSSDTQSDSECENNIKKPKVVPQVIQEESLVSIEDIDLTISESQVVEEDLKEPDVSIILEKPTDVEVNLRNVSVTTLFQAQVDVLSSGVLDSKKISIDANIIEKESPKKVSSDENNTLEIQETSSVLNVPLGQELSTNVADLLETNLEGTVEEKEESFTKLPEDVATFVLENEINPKIPPEVNLNESHQENFLPTLISESELEVTSSHKIIKLTDEALLNVSVPENNPEIPQVDTTLFEESVTNMEISDHDRDNDETLEEQPNLICPKCNIKCDDTKSFVNHYAKHSYAATATKQKKKKIKKPVKKVKISKTDKVTPEQPEEILDETFIQTLIDVNLPKADDLTIQQVAMNTSVDQLYNDLQISEMEKQEPRKSLRVKSARKVAVKTIKRKSSSSIKYQCAFCDKRYVLKSRIESHITLHLSNINKLPEITNVESIIESIKTPKSSEIIRKSNRVKKETEKMKELKKKEPKKHILKRKEEYQCSFCNKTFPLKLRLEKHIMSHLNKTSVHSYKCTICTEEFTALHLLETHQIIHNKPFSCDICSKRFKSISGKKNHEIVQHKNQCITCKTQLKSEKALEVHILKTHETIKCTHCEKYFRSQSEVDSHTRKDHKNINYYCHLCKYATQQKSVLDTHIESHEMKDFKLKMKQRLQDSKYPCVYCNQDFTNDQDQREHANIVHSNAYPFTCQYCSFRSRNEITIQKHLIVHEDFPCPKCPHRFKLLPKLNEHIKLHGINNVTVTKDSLSVLFLMPGTSKSNNYIPIRNSNDIQNYETLNNVRHTDDLLDHSSDGKNKAAEVEIGASSPKPLADVVAKTPNTRSVRKSSRKIHSDVDIEKLVEETSNIEKHSSVVEPEEEKDVEMIEREKEEICKKGVTMTEEKKEKKEATYKKRIVALKHARLQRSLKLAAKTGNRQGKNKQVDNNITSIQLETPQKCQTEIEGSRSLRKRKAEDTDMKPSNEKKRKTCIVQPEEQTTSEIGDSSVNLEESRSLRKRKAEDIKPSIEKKRKTCAEKPEEKSTSVTDTCSLTVLRSKLMDSLNASKSETKANEDSGKTSNSPERRSMRVMAKEDAVNSVSPDKKSGSLDNKRVCKKLLFNEENQTENSDTLNETKSSKSPKKLDKKQTVMAPETITSCEIKPVRSPRKKVDAVEEKSEIQSSTPTKESHKISEPQSLASGRVLRGQKLQETPEKSDSSEKSLRSSKKIGLKSDMEDLESEAKPNTKESKSSETSKKSKILEGEKKKSKESELKNTVPESSKKFNTTEISPEPKTSGNTTKKKTKALKLEKSDDNITSSPKKLKTAEDSTLSNTSVVKSGKALSKKQTVELKKSENQDKQQTRRPTRQAGNKETPTKSNVKKSEEKSKTTKKVSPIKTKESPKKGECQICNKALLANHVCIIQCDRCNKSYPTSVIDTHRCMRTQAAQKTCIKCKQPIFSLGVTHVCNK